MTGRVTKIKIAGVPKEKDYNALSFGRKMEYRHKIAEFQATARTTHVNQKRNSSVKAWQEFLKLYEVTEYYAVYNNSPTCRDDSYQVWFK